MNTYYIGAAFISNGLCHYGIKDQKWGIRRFQNEDGSLTEEGKKRYSKARNIERDLNKLDKAVAYGKGDAMKLVDKIQRLEKKIDKYDKKHPNNGKGNTKEYSSSMYDYANKLHTLENEHRALLKRRDDLQQVALERGMNVSTKYILRDTIRPGEDFVKRTLSGFGATSIDTISPVTIGLRFKVRKPH